MMKKLLAIFLTVCLMLGAVPALAAGNATIAVRGQNDFDDYISAMQVVDGKLLLSSWNGLYIWDPATREMVEVEGYADLENQVQDELDLTEEDTYAYFDGTLYVIGDKLYRGLNVNHEDEASFMLVELIIDENNTVSIGEKIDLADALLMEENSGDETWYYTRNLELPCSAGGMLYALSYGDNGREILKIDIEDASVEEMTLDFDGEVQTMTAYTEGKLLLVVVDYNADPVATKLYAYDLEAEEVTELGTLPHDGYSYPGAIAYDAERSKIYFSLSGSVWRVDITDEGISEAVEFGDMPLEIYSDAQGIVIGEMYVVSGNNGVVGRDVTTEKMPEQQLRVVNSTYNGPIVDAYYGFTDQHPEYVVSISRNATADTLVQSMMNRDSTVDIYVMDSTESVLQTLMSRGYMAELEDNEEISAAVKAMYPFIQDNCMKDGHVYMLPLNSYADCMTINVSCLEKLGYTEADVPTSWAGLMNLLSDIAANDRMQEAPEITISDPYLSQRWFKQWLFSEMLEDYFLWLDQSEDNVARSGEVLLTLCKAFEAVDWTKLGLREDDEEEGGMYDYNEETLLLETGGVGFNTYRFEGASLMPLSVMDGEEPMISARVDFAFVNPFSKHKEEAIEYLAQAWACVDVQQKMQIMPDMNDPVANPYYEETVQNNLTYMDELNKQLAETTDEEEREIIQANITSQEEWFEEWKVTGKYSISQEDIDAYRAEAKYLRVQKTNHWSSEESSTQVSQYMGGAITAEQLVNELEKTMQMQRLEGN